MTEGLLGGTQGDIRWKLMISTAHPSRNAKTLNSLPQERGGPDRGVVTQLAGIGVDDLSDQRIDDPQCRGGTAWAWGIRQTGAEIESLTLLKAFHPVVDR